MAETAACPRIDIDRPAPPPRWALLQRLLIEQLDAAAVEFVDRYTRPNGTLHWRDNWPGMDGSDDPYEAFQNLALLYVLGGDRQALTLAEHVWEGITWQWTQYGQIHDEFDGYYDWMHHGEGSLLLYFLGMAHPSALKWKQRAIKFADLYAGSDAINYDPVHRIIRAPLTGSRGPRFTVTAEDWSTHRPVLRRSPFEDIPGITLDTPYPWLDDDVFAQILERMNERMTRGDVPWNLNATGLAAHAYMFTGEDRYRDWALAYVQAWAERADANGGVVPDNIGLSGKVGEYNDGKWWGGYYGWRWPRGLKDILEATTNGAVNATLLSGDSRWLATPRRQLDASWEQRRRGADGAWLLPQKHTDEGWTDYQIPPAAALVHLWYTSMADEDAERLDGLDHPGAWRTVYIPHTSGDDPQLGRSTKHLMANTLAWYDYIHGHNPAYPEQILEANLEAVNRQLTKMRSDAGDPSQWDLDHPMSIHQWQEMCPVVLEGLVQLTLGAPMHISHGGLQHARLRYYDAQRERLGLPPDCAALVSDATADSTTVELVNLSATQEHDLIIQAGAFSEHEFSSVDSYDAEGSHMHTADIASVGVGTRLHVCLGRGTSAKLVLGTRRYTRRPSYATPWADTASIPTIRGRTAHAPSNAT